MTVAKTPFANVIRLKFHFMQEAQEALYQQSCTDTFSIFPGRTIRQSRPPHQNLLLTGNPSWRPSSKAEAHLCKIFQVLMDTTGFHLYHTEADLLSAIRLIYDPLVSSLDNYEGGDEIDLEMAVPAGGRTPAEITKHVAGLLNCFTPSAVDDSLPSDAQTQIRGENTGS